MRKRVWGLIVLSYMLAGCSNQAQTDVTGDSQNNQSLSVDSARNYLGGNGELKGNSGGAADMFTCVIEDNDNYYYAGYCIPKNGDTVAYSLCNTIGCNHDNANCNKYIMVNNVSYSGNEGFYFEGFLLYDILSNGKKTFIADFSKDSYGEDVPDWLRIRTVYKGNDGWIYIGIGDGKSRLYNTMSKKEIFLEAYKVEFLEDICVYRAIDNSVHCINLETEKDDTLCSSNVYNIKSDGEYVFYSDRNNIYKYNQSEGIRKMDISTDYNMAVIDAYDGKLIYSIDDYNPLYAEMSFLEYHMLDGDIDNRLEISFGEFQRCEDTCIWMEGNGFDEITGEYIYNIFTYNINTGELKQYDLEG